MEWSYGHNGSVAKVMAAECLPTIAEVVAMFRKLPCGGKFIVRFHDDKSYVTIEPNRGDRKALITFGQYHDEYTVEDGHFAMSYYVV